MKTLIIRNNLKIKLDNRLADVKKYFSSKREFEFTVIDKKFTYFDLQKDSINGYIVDRISDTWFDELVSKPYRNDYDCVILMISKKDWKSGNIVQGYRTHNNLGIQEIVMLVDEVDGYNFMGKQYDGDQITWILKHELMHALCLKEGIVDNVHPYYINGTPDKLIEELKDSKPMSKYKYFNEQSDPKMIGVNPKLMKILDTIRGECGFPITITSGFRTKEENAKLKGSVKDSEHLLGLAVDIAVSDDHKRYKILKSAFKNEILRIGVGTGFIHLGIDASKPQEVVWGYLD